MEFETTSISSDQSNQSETYGSKNRKNMIFKNNVVIQINELKFLRGDRNTFIDMLIIGGIALAVASCLLCVSNYINNFLFINYINNSICVSSL